MIVPIPVVVKDPVLAAAITQAISAALAETAPVLAEPRLVGLKSRAGLARLLPELPGALAIVTVTPRNARHLVELADGLRAAGAAGIQLVWDGGDRARIERHVFAVLERARATPQLAPIILAATARPVPALLALIAYRGEPR
ncbi:MAG: hypothetical protein ABI867_04830 [Kofleriaceae bacterium]